MNLSSNINVVGTCSLCGGLVVKPSPPSPYYPNSVPKCSSCGAYKKQTLPIVEMEAPNVKPQLLNE